MSKKSMPIYLTEDQHKELKDYHDAKYPHMSFYGMIIDLALKAMRSNK